MALVNIVTAIPDIIKRLESVDIMSGIEVMSYKRNRTVAIIKKESNLFVIQEKGYKDQQFEIPGEQMAKSLKKIFKREFPRSRKVRIFRFHDPKELERVHQKI